MNGQIAVDQSAEVAPKKVPTRSVPRGEIAIPRIATGKAPLNMAWCWIPGGPFAMGSNDRKNEHPIHEVNTEGFWLACYPVTNAQYRLFVEANGYTEQRWWSREGWGWRQTSKFTEPGYWTDKKWDGDSQPVVGISWYEAEAYCRWAAEVTGEPIRLPTEAEWEKAARGTDKRKYPWGDIEPDAKLCNFQRNVGQTTAVDRYSPAGDSPYGCVDMAGNVWEWTDSWYQAYPGSSYKSAAFGGTHRVLRGGSWYGSANDVRTSNRSREAPDFRINDVGFRCASTAF